MKTLAIIGSGHLGQQIAHFAIEDNHYNKIVFIDDYNSQPFVNGIAVIGKTIETQSLYQQGKFDELIIGIGYNHLSAKKEFFEKFNHHIPFGKIIHSSTYIDPSALIEDGVVIYPRCNIDANVIIEANSIINIGCTIAHDTKVGKHCFLSPSVALAGFIKIGENCIIGINACIIDNVFLVAHVQLGAGTVVTQNIDEKGLYVGNPHRFIR